MSYSVRTTAILCFLVVNLAACGGSSPAECDTCASQESALPCGSTSGCDEPGVDPVVRVSLTVTAVNRSNITRQCFALAQWVENGQPVTGGLSEFANGGTNPDSIIPAGASRSRTVSVPKDVSVRVLGACFQPYASHIDYASAESVFTVTRTSSWSGSYFLPAGGVPAMEQVVVK